jgi:adenosylcobinamide kinase / adenosylcobinamide-phosphate guanylyltransferase
MSLTLLTGGARSGKSSIAVDAARRSGRPVTFVATAEPRDDDLADRVRRHREERPPEWTVVEEPLDLIGALGGAVDDDVVIVDCLTLWLSNLVESGVPVDDVAPLARRTAAMAAARAGATFVVTNEVGSGIVPVAADVRRWRDLLGRVNAAFSAHADDAYLVVAGRLLALRSPSTLLP